MRGPLRVPRGALFVLMATPGAAAWALLGWLLSLSSVGVRWRLWPLLAYAVVFGMAEVLEVPLRVPGRRWQVPSTWIQRGRWSQAATWGALLGPGLLTINPFASMWLLPLTLYSLGRPILGAGVGAAAGAVHGLARARGVETNAKRLAKLDLSDLLVKGPRVRRQLDGAILLCSAGLVVGFMSHAATRG